MTGLRIGLASALLALVGPAEAGAFDRESAERLIVRIVSEVPGHRTSGAGVVFAVRRGSVYVVTANHVVRRARKTLNVRGGGAAAPEWSRLQVSFRLPTGEVAGAAPRALEAEAADHWDSELDLAVLRVVPEAGEPGWRLLSDLILALRLVPATAVAVGDRVWPVGHPGGRSWFVPPTPPR